MNRSISLLALLSLFSILPSSAHALDLSIAFESSPQLAQVTTDSSIAVGSPLNIEETIIGEAGSSAVEREYTFQGNQNEMIVVYLEQSQDYPFDASVAIIDPEGKAVSAQNSYHEGLDFAETDGRHRVFLLPTTGTYQISFSGETYETYRNETDIAELEEYLLRIRLASYTERLVILGSRMMDEERYDAALPLFTLAIEESPEQPLPYMGRVLSHMITAADEIDESILDSEDEFVVASEVFQALLPETQLLVIEDLKQAGAAGNALIAKGKTTEEQVGFDFDILIEGATFFETGIASDELIRMVQETFY